MKLLINTASSFKGGGVQVAKSIIEEFKSIPQHDYIVVLGYNFRKTIKLDDFPENFSFYNAPFRPASKVFSLKSHNRFLRKIEAYETPDIVFTTTGPSYWRPKAKHIVGYNLPHYIYPDSPYFEIIPIRKKIYWKLKGAVIKYFFKKDADVIIVQTEDVNERLSNVLKNSNIYNIFNTVSSHYRYPKKYPNKLSTNRENSFRLLTLSAWYPHKNINIIPKVVRELKNMNYHKIQFILTLPNKDFLQIYKPEYENYIINVGPVRIEEGASLYNECDAMFLPTLLECFSASYVEAMQLDKPIITSDLSFAHSVCGDAALYVNPLCPVDIAAKIVELYESNDLYKKLVKKGKKKLLNYGSSRDRALNIMEIIQKEISLL